MSNLTKTSAGPNGSTASPVSPVATRRTRGPRLSGVTWLIWRQHRAAYWTLLAATALSLAWIAYQRTGLMDYLAAHGWPDSPDKWLEGMGPYSAEFQKVGLGLGFIPILFGVFLGAPLLAGDLENGTAKLVTSQSVSPVRWLAAKLGISALVVVVCTVALSVQFGWWFGLVKNADPGRGWSEGFVFDNTGPVPVALSLFTFVGGLAIGMLLRRTLLAMVVTFTFAVVVQVVWAYCRLDLGNIVTVATNKGINAPPSGLPDGALEIDRSYATGSGESLGWSTCAHEASETARDACVQKADIVGWSVDYLPISQMSGMQWFGASILFALTAAVAVFIFMWGRKRLV
ncbi:ABC transporter [Streptomyces sp. NPDC005181]|uniref:ABC transporter n=1 Tax=Streptomyces sp. NPDC005181 TaxID=3156869 RepID=UPI0033BD7EE7